MGKTRAQYRKDYRERKKKNDKEFLKRERERTKHYKLPIGALSEEKRRELREKNINWKWISREKLRRINTQETEEKEDRPRSSEAETNEDKADSSQATQQSSKWCLTVKLDFKPRQWSQKRSKALRTASRRIKNKP
ncbi:hypothetical protein ACJMK2_040544 [Sinanodonta woodiana]|uniref:Uncharacterized protein n=1 Tax=Sinanodonta woodiana TaxID=1069815 RepID=A0ABD3W4I9_SINWO